MAGNVDAQNTESTGGCNYVLMLLTTVFGFLLYLQVVQNRQRIAVIEGCLGGGYLLLFLFPTEALSYILPLDKNEPSVCIFLLLLACLLSQAVVFQMTKNSTTPEVAASLTIVNILTRSSMVLCAIYGTQFVTPVSNFACVIILVLFIPLILGDLIQFFKISSKPYITVGDPVSWHLSVDAMLTFFFGGFVLAFSEVFYEKLNGADLLLVKMLGSVLLTSSILSFAGLCFQSKKDALAVLKSKCVMHMLFIVITSSSYLTDKRFWNNGHPLCLMLSCGVLLYNAGYAMLLVNSKCKEI